MRDARPDPWELLPVLRALANQPYAAEVLDVLGSGPKTVRQMRVALPRSRWALGRALRELVLGGLVNDSRAGSWDDRVCVGTRYQTTERGRLVIRMLSSFSVWTSIYENQGAVTNPAP